METNTVDKSVLGQEREAVPERTQRYPLEQKLVNVSSCATDARDGTYLHLTAGMI